MNNLTDCYGKWMLQHEQRIVKFMKDLMQRFTKSVGLLLDVFARMMLTAKVYFIAGPA